MGDCVPTSLVMCSLHVQMYSQYTKLHAKFTSSQTINAEQVPLDEHWLSQFGAKGAIYLMELLGD